MNVKCCKALLDAFFEMMKLVDLEAKLRGTHLSSFYCLANLVNIVLMLTYKLLIINSRKTFQTTTGSIFQIVISRRETEKPITGGAFVCCIN